MCRSKEKGGRRCAGRRKKVDSQAATAAVLEVEAPPASTLNPNTPKLNRLLTAEPEEWFALPWRERKQASEDAFHEMRATADIEAKWGGWNRMTVAVGRTTWQGARWGSWDTPTIKLSDENCRKLTAQNVADTLAHELAHAKAGPNHGHGHVWREQFTDIKDDFGMAGDIATTHSDSEVEQQQAAKLHEEKVAKASVPVWLGLCPQGHRFGKGRQVTRTYVCLKCDTRSYKQEQREITYTRNTNKETL